MIEELKKSPQFQKAMQEIRAQSRIQPRVFHPKNEIAVDQWKYESGWIAGFDFLYELLTSGDKK